MFLLLCYLFLFVLQRWHVSKLQIRMILRRRAWCYNLRVFLSICCRTLMFLTFLVWPSFWTWRCAMMNLCTGWKKDSLLLLAFAWLLTDVHDRDNYLKCLLFLFSGLMYKGRRLWIFWSNTIFSMNPFFSLFMGASCNTFSQHVISSFHSNNFKIKNNQRKH